MANVGFATLQVIPSFSGAQAAMTSGISGPATVAGSKAGGLFGGGMASALKKAAPVALIAGIGGGLLKLGSTFQQSFKTIRVATGQTGFALEGLETSFKNVAKTRPDSFDDVSTAISKLNVGLGLTGPNLEALSTQVLRLSSLTKTDLGGNLEAVTTLFNAFGVSADQQGGKLDELFRASQATGVGVSDLASAMASGGSLLKTAGLDFEQSAALLGLLQKTGVAASSVMAPLSKSIANAAKSGKTASDVFKDTFDAIRSAPDATKAAGAAIDVFGARAGPKLAGLIREGKLSYEQLASTIATGTDTIAAAASDTSTISGKFKVLKNAIAVGLEPLASGLFDSLNSMAKEALPIVIDGIDQVANGIHGLAEAFKGEGVTSDGFVGTMEQIGVALRDLFDDFQPLIQFIRGHLKPILLAAGVAFLAITSPVALVAGALIAAYVRFKGFRDGIATVVAWLSQNVPPAFEKVKQVISDVAAVVGPILQAATATIIEAFSAVVAWVRTNWPAISEAVGHVLAVVQGVIQGFIAVVSAAWNVWGDDIFKVVQGVFAGIKNEVETVIGVVRGIIETALALINGDWGKAWDGLKGIIDTVWEGIKGTISAAIDVITGVLGGAGDLIATAASGMFDGIKSAFKAVINWIIDGWNGLDFHIEGKLPFPPHTKIDFTLGVPDIPKLHGGGTFSSPPGSKEGLALLLDGERVLSPAQTADFESRAATPAPFIGGDLIVQQLPGEDVAGALDRTHRKIRLLAS